MGRLEEDNAAMFFIIENSEEITFNFSQNLLLLFDLV